MTQTEPAALENAEAIIEKFGGIRPMATKINVPVTTVQGWKKRNVIPGTRRAEILSAAKEHGVDLTEILDPPRVLQGPGSNVPNSIANENDRSSFAKMVDAPAPKKPVASSHTPDVSSSPQQDRRRPAGAHAANSEFENELMRSERRAVTKSTAINLFLVILAIVSVIMLLLPQSDRRLDRLENEVVAIKQKQSFLSSLIPDDIQSKLNYIQGQLTGYHEGLGSALGKAKTISDDVVGPGGGTLQQRTQKLETHMGELGISTTTNLSGLAAKLQGLAGSVGGQQQLNDSTQQLMALLAGVPAEDPAQVDAALQNAHQDPTLSQTFQGVPQQDLKAAAMLLGMTQFRSTLNRDNQPFEQDLMLMKKLAGDDPELQASIDRLAPYAQQGVLTPSGLTNEFRSLAGDVAVASLSGEDVSIQEKAEARFGDMFQVEKNGEQITGTETQKTLAKTDQMLQSGDLEGAIAQMQTLDGNALTAAQPWINKAQATLMAQKFKHFLTGAINSGSGIVGTRGPLYNAGSPATSPMPSARGLNLPGSSKLIQDDETGINILRPDTGAPAQ
jgi:hypothetical protein